MRERQRVAGRLQPRLLVVAVVVAAVVAATAFVSSDGADGTSTPVSALAGETSPAASDTSRPLVTTPPAVGLRGRPAPQPFRATTPDVDAAQPAGAATMVAAAPVRLQIPSIGVESKLMDLGLQADGSLEVPPNGFPAGWYTGAPTPGEPGPAIIAGHVDWGGQAGVFFDLRDLVSGDAIAITREDGSTADFRVVRVERYAKDEFPTQAVYGDLDHAGLRLITCGGDFDQRMRSYNDNLVVYAELV